MNATTAVHTSEFNDYTLDDTWLRCEEEMDVDEDVGEDAPVKVVTELALVSARANLFGVGDVRVCEWFV